MKRSECLLNVPGFRDRSFGVGVGIGVEDHSLQMQSLHDTPAKQGRLVCNVWTNRYLQTNGARRGTCFV